MRRRRLEGEGIIRQVGTEENVITGKTQTTDIQSLYAWDKDTRKQGSVEGGHDRCVLASCRNSTKYRCYGVRIHGGFIKGGLGTELLAWWKKEPDNNIKLQTPFGRAEGRGCTKRKLVEAVPYLQRHCTSHHLSCCPDCGASCEHGWL